MKKGMFSMMLATAGLTGFNASAQLSASLTWGALFYSPPLTYLAYPAVRPAAIWVVKPSPVVVIPAPPAVLVRPSVYITRKPKKRVVVYR